MKNKKGGKAQKFISQVEKQVKSGGDPRARKIEEERAAEKKRKEAAKLEEEEKKKLFRPVATQKVANGKKIKKEEIEDIEEIKSRLEDTRNVLNFIFFVFENYSKSHNF